MGQQHTAMKHTGTVLCVLAIIGGGCAIGPESRPPGSLPAATTAMEPSTPTDTKFDSEDVAVPSDTSHEAPVETAVPTTTAAAVELGGVAVVAFHLPGTATPIQNQQVGFGRDVGATGVFDPNVDGQFLTFWRMPDAASSAGPAAFTDDQTGSTWTVLGRALDGPLAGTQPQPIEHVDTFWFAAAAYDPEIELLAVP